MSELTLINIPRNALANWAPVPLRFIVGYGFMAHGLAKLGRGPEHFADILNALGVPLPYIMSLATIAIEILGGAMILAGAFVSVASIPMAIILIVAMFSVHWQYGFSSIKLQAITPTGAQFGQPGIECDLLYLACLAALALGGPGPISVDAYRMNSKDHG